MKGRKTKYYIYEKTTSGRVTIPNAIAESLGWSHLDDLYITFKFSEGKAGVFIFKEDKKKIKE